jgi:hypothetical protein
MTSTDFLRYRELCAIGSGGFRPGSEKQTKLVFAKYQEAGLLRLSGFLDLHRDSSLVRPRELLNQLRVLHSRHDFLDGKRQVTPTITERHTLLDGCSNTTLSCLLEDLKTAYGSILQHLFASRSKLAGKPRAPDAETWTPPVSRSSSEDELMVGHWDWSCLSRLLLSEARNGQHPNFDVHSAFLYSFVQTDMSKAASRGAYSGSAHSEEQPHEKIRELGRLSPPECFSLLFWVPLDEMGGG